MAVGILLVRLQSCGSRMDYSILRKIPANSLDENKSGLGTGAGSDWASGRGRIIIH